MAEVWYELLKLALAANPKRHLAVIAPENRVVAIGKDEFQAAKRIYPRTLRAYLIHSITYRSNGYATVWLYRKADSTPE